MLTLALSAVAILAGAPPVPATPRIEGTVEIGHVVTCSEGDWPDAATLAVEWLRDGVPVPGAVDREYAIVEADAGLPLTCRVTGSNDDGSSQSTSNRRLVPAIPPQAISLPTITGTAAVGGTLTCNPGTFTGAPPPHLIVEWLRDGSLPMGPAGPDGLDYHVTPLDGGRTIVCRVSAANRGGMVTVMSAPVIPAPPPPLPLAGATPEQVAAALGLPGARRCIRSRRMLVRLREPTGIQLRRAELRIGRERFRARRVNGRLTARLPLSGPRRRRFAIDLHVVTLDGRELRGRRAYRLCARR
jgi:hypothetical protein